MITFQSDYLPLKRILVKSSAAAFQGRHQIQEQWKRLHYNREPDFGRAGVEFDGFVRLLKSQDIEVVFAPQAENVGLDSIYVRDAALVTDQGAILGRMGKPERAGEPEAMRGVIEDVGLPILGGIEAPGTLEGGDLVWLDEETLAVGYGYRTNGAGIEQLRDLLPSSIKLEIVPLPHYKGPTDVFHLMSMISPIDRDLAVVYSPLLPVPFRNELLARGFVLIDVPDQEFDSMGTNVLALGPRNVVVVNGNPKTRALLAQAGCSVHVYEGNEISHAGSGGPTCLTQPLEREFIMDKS